MKILKITATLIATGILVAGVSILWIGSGLTPVPDLGKTTVIDREVYNPTYSASIEKASAQLVDARVHLVAPALSLAVGVDGELVWAEAHGFANLSTMDPVKITTRFPIGSVSKSITAAAVSQLVETGAIDLDADIHTYVPGYPPQEYEITTRQLLSHQAGIRHYNLAFIPPVFSEMGLNRQFNTVKESLVIFENDDLLFEPDTDFSYSSFGYTLISAVIEGASNKEFLLVLEDQIFSQLNMNRSQANYSDRKVSDKVSGCISRFSDKQVLPEPVTNSSNKWAGGGLLSTPSDLVKFGNALLAGQLLQAETLKMMFTPRKTSNGELNPQHYGLGWRIGGMYYPGGTEEIITMINHGGTAMGAISVLVLMPDSGLVFAMSANSAGDAGSSALLPEAASMIRIFLDQLSGDHLI